MCLKFILTTIVLLFFKMAFSQEICNNNIDDDGDGKIDLFDVKDCPCIQDSVLNKLIRNGSFEDVQCVANGLNYLNCADGWRNPTLATSDLYMQNGYFPTYIPTSLPDGNNCAGFLVALGYHEYISSCLMESMLAGESYFFQFDVVYPLSDSIFVSEVNFLSLYGKLECDTIQLDSFSCLESVGWNEIGRVTYLPQHEWSTVEMIVEPYLDVSQIALGPSCNAGTQSDTYFLVDNLRMEHAIRQPIYFIPNAFTPNGDEFNQYFKPVFVCGFDDSDYSFEVYNRWGELIFVSFDAEIGWDGTYNNQIAEGDIFGWKITYKNEHSARREIITGSVSLLK